MADALDGAAVRVLADEAAFFVAQRRAVTLLALLARADGAASTAIPHNRDSGRTSGLHRRALAGVGAMRPDLQEYKKIIKLLTGLRFRCKASKKKMLHN